MAGRFSVEGIFRLVDRVTRPMQRIQSRLDRFQRATTRGFRDLRAMGQRFKVGFLAVAGAVVAAAGGIVAALQDIVEVGMDFEQTLTRAASKFPGQVRPGTEAFRRLEEAARRVGAETSASSSGAAGALDALAGAGFNADQAISALPGVVTLATASQLELEEATSIAASSLATFGLRAEDSAQLAANLTRVNDVLARTAADTDADVRDLFESIQNGGQVAASTGASIETFAAMVGVLSGTGLKGAEAGTALRNVFQSLAAPTARAQRALRRLHVSTVDGNGNMRDAVDILGDMSRAMAGMSNARKAQVIAQIFERATSPAVLALMAAGSDRIGELRTRLEGAAGAAQEMAEVMGDTTAGDLAEMDSAIEALKLSIFDLVKGPLREVVAGITEWVRANQDVITSGIQNVVTFLIENMPTIVTWARRIGIGLLIVAGIVGVSLAIFVGAFALIGAVIWTVIVLIIELGAWLYENIGGIAQAIGDFFIGMWERVVAFFKPAIEFVVGLFVMLGREIMDRVRPAMAVIQAAAARFMERWRPVGAFFSALWSGVVTTFRNVWASVMGEAGGLVEALQEIWAPIGEFFANLWNGIVESFRSAFGPILDGIGEFISQARAVGAAEMAGEGDADAPSAASQARVASPQERVARNVTESTRTERAEVTIRDETGRAQQTRRPRTRGAQIRVQPSGAM